MHSLLQLLFSETVGYGSGTIVLGIADALALVSVPSVLFRRQGQPLAAMSWLLALFFLPFLGVLGWWTLGRERVHRKQRLRQESSATFRESLEQVGRDEDHPREREALGELLPSGLFDHYGRLQLMGPTAGNRAELLVDGGEVFPAIEEVIEGAEEYVHLLFYIWQDDETGRRLRDLLVEKAREGVEVRVLVDAFGSPAFKQGYVYESELAAPLLEAGGRIARFLPPTFVAWRPTFNFRNHRKLVVADGREAVTGGMNVGDEYEHDWHDMGVRLRGPVVQDLHTVFLDDWLFASGENLAADRYLEVAKRASLPDRRTAEDSVACAVFASGPDSDEPVLEDGLLHAINGAHERIWMMTPYFIPTPEILGAFRSAVQRGVDVRLILPERGDVPIVRRASRSYYPQLLDSGVRLFEYRPRVLHAKAAIVDSQHAILGSANLDVRSFAIDFELTTFLSSTHFNARLAEVFESNFRECREIEREHVRKRSWLSRLADSLAHLTSSQL